MKILLWPTRYFPNIGGLEKMVHSLATALRDKGHEILVICYAEETKTWSIDGISVYSFPFIDVFFQCQLGVIRQILIRIAELFDSFAPDVVHIHGWYEGYSFFQRRILENRTVPVCLTLHGLLEQPHYHTANCLKVWNRAQAVSTVSRAIIPDHPHPFLQTIYNGLPVSKVPLQPLPTNRLLLVGRISEEKCYDIAFYAIKMLLLKYPGLEMTLVGDGPDYKKLLELKQSLQVPVHMVGFVAPTVVEQYIDESTLVLVPSSYESFSLVALEAALRARPVVASRVLGLKEVIEDGKTGLLVEPQNPEALAMAIDTLLSDIPRMEQMGCDAFARAKQLFSLETTVNHYLSMYTACRKVL